MNGACMMTPDFQQILTATPGGIVAADTDGKITFINSAADKQLNLSFRQKTGSHVSTISTRLSELLNTCLTETKPLYSREFQFPFLIWRSMNAKKH